MYFGFTEVFTARQDFVFCALPHTLVLIPCQVSDCGAIRTIMETHQCVYVYEHVLLTHTIIMILYSRKYWQVLQFGDFPKIYISRHSIMSHDILI